MRYLFIALFMAGPAWAGTPWLGVLESKLTQLRPLFEFSDGKWKKTTLAPTADLPACTLASRGKTVGKISDLTNAVPVRNSPKVGDCQDPFLVTKKEALGKSFDKLTGPTPVLCGGRPVAEAAGWKEAKHFDAKDRELLRAAFLKVEPIVHVCLQDPKIMMGADPNQKEQDIKLKPTDLTPRGYRSANGDLLAEITSKYVEMCGKPLVYTGRWFYIPKGKPAVDLDYDLKLVDYGDFNDDKVTDFLFEISEDGNSGYTLFDGKTNSKVTFSYFCL